MYKIRCVVHSVEKCKDGEHCISKSKSNIITVDGDGLLAASTNLGMKLIELQLDYSHGIRCEMEVTLC